MAERLILHIRISKDIGMKLDDLVAKREKTRSEVVRDLIRNSHKALAAK